MEPSLPPPIPEPQPEKPRPPAMSLAARLLNVFATPGEVFEDVKAAPSSVANWLVPAVLLAVVSVLFGIVMASQPAIRQQIREQQAKSLDQRVAAGHMTRAQADQTLDMLDKATLPIVVVSMPFVGLARVFWW